MLHLFVSSVCLLAPTFPSPLSHDVPLEIRAFFKFSLSPMKIECWLMLIGADWSILIVAYWCWLMLVFADWSWLELIEAILIEADWCRLLGKSNLGDFQSSPSSSSLYGVHLLSVKAAPMNVCPTDDNLSVRTSSNVPPDGALSDVMSM